MGLFDILGQVLGGAPAGGQQPGHAVNSAPADVLAKGLAAAFRSEHTPAIGQLVAQLFGNSNGAQQAGMLNQLLAAVGPEAASGLGGGALARAMSPGAETITPEQAAQLSVQDVQDAVDHAHEAHPGIAEQLAGFYSRHSGLINTMGGAVLAVAMTKMQEHAAQA